MFVALKRWVAIGILGGMFLAGGLSGYVLRWSKEGKEPALASPAAAPASATVPAARREEPATTPVAATPPPPQAPIIVKVVTEPYRPPASPAPKAATAKAPVVPEHPADRPADKPAERPAALGVPELKSTPTPGHYYKIQAGDTLHEVAVKAYGSAKRIGDVIHANAALDPNRLRIGAVVYVPAGIEPVPSGPGEAPKPVANPPASSARLAPGTDEGAGTPPAK